MRHRFGLQLETVPAVSTDLAGALKQEASGNWWIAAELFCTLAKKSTSTAEIQARLLTRGAGCFEAAGAFRESALTYVDAANSANQANVDPQVVGELDLLASHGFRQISDPVSCAHYSYQAAIAFARVQRTTIVIEDRIPPLPMAAGPFTFAAECYMAAARAFLLANDLAQARGCFWYAGTMNLRQGHGYSAAQCFREALIMCARFDRSLAKDDLRAVLPLTTEERAAKADPIEMMERAIERSGIDHKKLNPHLPNDWVIESTDRFMVSALEAFARELSIAGNPEEAGKIGALASERRRKGYVRNRRWLQGVIYWFWAVSSGYGTDPARWLATVLGVALFYACIYGGLRLIEPTNDWIDPLYFSVVTMTTVGYGDIHPTGNLGKAVACSEIFFGMAMLGALISIVSKRLMKD
jgi:hypothetical protein